MRYAVFDWDNTVRSGYTLFSWIDYLCMKNILDSNLQLYIKNLQTRYQLGEINHDQYADYAACEYTKAIKGKKKSLITSGIDEYMLSDTNKIFPFSETLFKLLNDNNIAIIIISGAPSFIIEKYQREFFINDIYAFSVKENNGIYTGEIENNFGCNKEATIRQLIDKYNELPLMGFGDSQSDIPLLAKAKYPFCIFDKEKKIKQNSIGYIQNCISAQKISEIIMPCIADSI